jgi:hypothetical protein
MSYNGTMAGERSLEEILRKSSYDARKLLGPGWVGSQYSARPYWQAADQNNFQIFSFPVKSDKEEGHWKQVVIFSNESGNVVVTLNGEFCYYLEKPNEKFREGLHNFDIPTARDAYKELDEAANGEDQILGEKLMSGEDWFPEHVLKEAEKEYLARPPRTGGDGFGHGLHWHDGANSW